MEVLPWLHHQLANIMVQSSKEPVTFAEFVEWKPEGKLYEVNNILVCFSSYFITPTVFFTNKYTSSWLYCKLKF